MSKAQEADRLRMEQTLSHAVGVAGAALNDANRVVSYDYRLQAWRSLRRVAEQVENTLTEYVTDYGIMEVGGN